MKQGEENSNKVFVYGTLKGAFGNHRCMKSAEGEYLGAGTINATMFNLGGFPKVSLVAEHLVNVVSGELYEVSDEGITTYLDRLEGYPSFYDRKIVDVTLESGEPYRAWVYFIDSPKQTENLLTEGVWRGRFYDYD